MEDIISLELIKEMFNIEKSSESNKEALNKLMEIEDGVVKSLRGGSDGSVLQTDDFRGNAELIRKDEVFLKSIGKFLRQHNLNLDADKYNSLPAVISRVVSLKLEKPED